jgi:hypothetical protein
MATQSSAGSVTILRCIGRGKSATKTWRLLAGAELPEKTDFDAGAWFRAERPHLSNIVELSNLLTLLERDSGAFVIRGEPLPHIDLAEPVRRKKKPDKQGVSGFVMCRAASAGYCSTLINSRCRQPLT